MRTELSFTPLAGIETELLAVLAVDTQTEKGPDAKPMPELLSTDNGIKSAAAAVLSSGEYKAGANETVLIHAPAGLKAKRLLLVGLGKKAKATAHSVRSATGTAVRFTKPRGIRELAFALPEADFLPPGPCARAVAEGAFVGAFWSVSQGSEEPPALIVMRYEPAGVKDGPVLGLVGKGITFDTGGISIKPSDNMEKMKYDMAGSAAMAGAMRAIALLKPQVRVIGIICASENMPDGKAQKPGDVQTAMSGKTIEIINTDAEGRLVLADGLAYARQLGATHLIDAATLTGACVVALGMVNAGVFSNDEDTFSKFNAALETSGEKFWRLPLGDEYAEMIKSDIGDIKNTGGRYGGAITAADFLKVFAEDTPWIHLDIAAMAWIEENRPYIAKGPSGVAVRSILEWVRSYSA